MITTSIISLVILILLSSFFSGAEIALSSLNPIKVKTLVKQRKKGSKTLARLKEKSERTIITILIGNNIVNVASASLATYIATEKFGSKGLGIATGVMTLIILVFGEITPKTLATTHAERVSLFIARPILILSYIFYPLIVIFDAFASLISRLFKTRKRKGISETEIKTMLEFGVAEKVIDEEEKDIMHQAIRFSDIKAETTMTPLKKVFRLPAATPAKDALEPMLDSGFSRAPIYEGQDKKITGIVLLKDVMYYIHEKEGDKLLSEIATDPIFVPRKMEIDDVFKAFKAQQKHIALVEDEEKDEIIGLVTMEDLLEELMGEITDESDITPNTIIRISENTIAVHGDTLVSEINSFFQTSLPMKKKSLRLYELIKNNFPEYKQGAQLKMGNIVFILDKVDDDKIMKVRIKKKG
ncbi:MAG: HlyC/CorC family transporter [Parcubacteria group bacterium]|nr:HlyC/CorC family transporter [Parcubacteria group bacterium]